MKISRKLLAVCLFVGVIGASVLPGGPGLVAVLPIINQLAVIIVDDEQATAHPGDDKSEGAGELPHDRHVAEED